MPSKSTLSMFFSFIVLSLIDSLVVMLYSFAMRLLVFPPSLVLQIGHFIRVNTLIWPFSFEVAGIVENKESLIEIRLIVWPYPPFIVAMKVPIFFEFVNFYVSFGQLILILGLLIGVDEIVGRLQFPTLVGRVLKFGEPLDFMLNVVVDMREGCCFSPDGCVLPGEIFRWFELRLMLG